MREVALPTVGWQSIIWQRLYKSNLFILFGSLHKCILLKWNYVFAQNVEDQKYLIYLVVHSLKFTSYLSNALFFFIDWFLLVMTRDLNP